VNIFCHHHTRGFFQNEVCYYCKIFISINFQIEHGLQLHSEVLREIVDKERLRAEIDAVKFKNQEEIASLETTCFQTMTTQLVEDQVRHMFFE